MTRYPLVVMALAAWAGCVVAPSAVAQEPQRSLADRRLEIIKGAPEARKGPDAAPPAPAAASAAARPASADATSERKPATGLRLPPPTGKPLNAARRLDGGGIPLPSAPPASQARRGS